MPVATHFAASSPRPSNLAKMEDRKRPAISNHDDIAPPTKKQALNGGGRSRGDDNGDTKEEAWIEVGQALALPNRSLVRNTLPQDHIYAILVAFITSPVAQILLQKRADRFGANARFAGDSRPSFQALHSLSFFIVLIRLAHLENVDVYIRPRKVISTRFAC